MSEPQIKKASRTDVEAIVHMLIDDQPGATRDSAENLTPYLKAFDAIDSDSNQLLVVAVLNGQTVATLQLTFIPGLSRRGALRGQIEAVRVHRDQRNSGLGSRLIKWAVDESYARGCTLVQLTSDTTRTAAHRFYERLGFKASHTGFKLQL